MISFHLQRTAQASARIAGLASRAPVVSPVLVEMLKSVTIAATATAALIVLAVRIAPRSSSKKTRVQRRRASRISGLSGERGESAVKAARGVGLELAGMNP